MTEKKPDPMTTLQFILAVLYGVLCIGALGRTVMAFTGGEKLWKPMGWLTSALGVGLILEIATPQNGSLATVMRGFIELVSWFF